MLLLYRFKWRSTEDIFSRVLYIIVVYVCIYVVLTLIVVGDLFIEVLQHQVEWILYISCKHTQLAGRVYISIYIHLKRGSARYFWFAWDCCIISWLLMAWYSANRNPTLCVSFIYFVAQFCTHLFSVSVRFLELKLWQWKGKEIM